VPETRADPESRLIALPVTRIRAMSEDPKEPVFFLTGAPGQSNMDFAFANRYTEDRDFVLVGYRGVDGSIRFDCPEVESALKRSTDVLSEEFFRSYGDGYGSCADRLTDEGIDLASYGLVQQVDDLETARVAFGYDQINLLSESAGTRTAMIYAWRYPESIHRSVMVAVNPPGAFLVDPDMADEQIGRFRIDNELLVILSVGVPIGLGTYWAWVHRDWSARSKRVGIAAVTAAALGGAWLGFQATDGPLALLTTNVGALASANLALLVLDMSRARSTRNQSAARTTAADAPSPEREPVAEVRSP
jgi:pimeloyl-ACP methyl ester carboxylesterase